MYATESSVKNGSMGKQFMKILHDYTKDFCMNTMETLNGIWQTFRCKKKNMRKRVKEAFPKMPQQHPLLPSERI